jgi:hypothetical protein
MKTKIAHPESVLNQSNHQTLRITIHRRLYLASFCALSTERALAATAAAMG